MQHRALSHGRLLLAGTDSGAVWIRPGPRRSPAAGCGRPPRALRQPRRAPGPLLQQHGRSRLGQRGHPPWGCGPGWAPGGVEGGQGSGFVLLSLNSLKLRSPRCSLQPSVPGVPRVTQRPGAGSRRLGASCCCRGTPDVPSCPVAPRVPGCTQAASAVPYGPEHRGRCGARGRGSVSAVGVG